MQGEPLGLHFSAKVNTYFPLYLLAPVCVYNKRYLSVAWILMLSNR